MIETKYEYYESEKYSNSFSDPKTIRGVVKFRHLDISKKNKLLIIFFSSCVLMSLSLISLFLLPIIFATVAFIIRTLVWGWGRELITTDDVPRNLKDEISGCCSIVEKIHIAANLTPEGSGIRARSNEYTILVFRTMQKLLLLKEVNKIMDGREKSFYTELTEMKTELDNLAASGKSLIEITAARRVDSVRQDLEFIGIKEFNESVSEETMIYRSLGSGDG